MQTEIITMTKIIAADGMVLTNGEVHGKVIFLATTDKAENYYEITDAEYEEILKQEEEAHQAELDEQQEDKNL